MLNWVDYLKSIMFIYKGILCLFICVFSTVGHVTLTHCSDWSNWIFLTLCENKPRFQYSISVISCNKHISGRNKKNWNISWQNLKQSLCIIFDIKRFPNGLIANSSWASIFFSGTLCTCQAYKLKLKKLKLKKRIKTVFGCNSHSNFYISLLCFTWTVFNATIKQKTISCFQINNNRLILRSTIK